MTIDWWTLGLQIINFLVLVWLLQRFLYRPVLAVIARRRELAEQALAEAERAQAEAGEARQRFEDERADLAETRQRLLQQTHAELETERRHLLDSAREEARRIVAAAHADIETERQAVLKEVQTQVADLAVDMSATLLKAFAERTSMGLDTALSRLEAELDALPAAERTRLAGDIGNPTALLTVATARALDPERQARWRAALLPRLDSEAELEFVVEPELIGGAELRFPHAVLSVAWSELLGQSRDELLAYESAH